MPATKISVLMTAYNRSRYIGAAIESVLASSFCDFDLIVVDDQSDDETFSIAERYRAIDTRVKVYRNSANLGDYPNRNRAVELASGEYIKFLDSDDYIYPYALAYMVAVMDAHPSSTFGLTRPADVSAPHPLEVQPLEAYRRHFLQGGFFDTGPSGAIMRRCDFIRQHSFEEVRMVGDVATWLKLGAISPVITLPQDLVWWRRHDEQEFASATKFEHVLNHYHVLKSALGADVCPLSQSEKETALMAVNRGHIRTILRLGKDKNSPSAVLRMLKRSGLTWRDIPRAFQ